MQGKIPVSESEHKLLELLVGRVEAGREYDTETLAELAGLDRSKVESLVRLLAEKGLVRLREETMEKYVATEEAKRYLREGFPEEKLVKILAGAGGEARLDELRNAMGQELSIALANATRKGWVEVRGGRVRLVVDPSKAVAEERKLLEKLEIGERLQPSEFRLLRRRRLVERLAERRTIVVFPEAPEKLLEQVVVEVGALTRDLIASGRWRTVRLRRYNVAAEPPRRRLGRLNFFVEFIEYLRDVMKEMGFQEVDDAPVELEFWNYDVLYQPQYHPARSPTDTFYLSNPSRGELPSELTPRVAEAHEKGLAGSRGWRYRWSQELAARLILRSHTTAVSARVLASKPRPPFRFFTIGRVYRVETIDPRHLPEFHQLDGIASEDGVSLRWLLGLLAEFLERIGIREYKFRPAYFPFTEPSVEAYVRVRDQWLEVLGAGLFRPEMLAALGIDYPVAAWGMGIERLAMALYDLTDIRQLYSHDVEFLENIPVRWWIYASSQI
ncbi:phenylalanine--tRNA ligase subunit alpha [Hyperthermus butylicus]|uniref:Phenylalanine--tRNA ligase alpha subunit n=1 Tax=Hyperthermus butylicus (strain DSM 5456 / JCM 9403 / PLM1-5) TaxID=415426 RepID=A2BL75_HYPBU|nr:phenylalanine--tRNA ligase subunit alpha [Hyperthermus butylicus]ABM80736.1 Phenylalanyl-tRNA synthetase alpha chain [Hyperthermus butylicus DSM 5456]